MGEYAHGPGPSLDFPKSPLQDVGGPNGPPKLLRETIVVETMKQVLLQTTQRGLGFIEPLITPGFEAPDRLSPKGGGKDRFCLPHARRGVAPFSASPPHSAACGRYISGSDGGGRSPESPSEGRDFHPR
jgi:hypothetical protein